MAGTNSCLPETVPLLTFHFRTRQATTADAPSIAKMIKVTFIAIFFFLGNKKTKQNKKKKTRRIEAKCPSVLGLVNILR